MDEIEHYVGCFFLWDLCHNKTFLLAPSTAEYLLLTDRALDSIPARLVPEDLRAWQFMHAAFVKSGLAKKPCYNGFANTLLQFKDKNV